MQWRRQAPVDAAVARATTPPQGSLAQPSAAQPSAAQPSAATQATTTPTSPATQAAAAQAPATQAATPQAVTPQAAGRTNPATASPSQKSDQPARPAAPDNGPDPYSKALVESTENVNTELSGMQAAAAAEGAAVPDQAAIATLQQSARAAVAEVTYGQPSPPAGPRTDRSTGPQGSAPRQASGGGTRPAPVRRPGARPAVGMKAYGQVTDAQHYDANANTGAAQRIPGEAGARHGASGSGLDASGNSAARPGPPPPGRTLGR
jgi:hypothetical protein